MSELQPGAKGDTFGLFSEEEAEYMPLRPRDRLAFHVCFGHLKMERLGPCREGKLAIAEHHGKHQRLGE